MYIYGGGWNEADTGAGKEAMTIGVSPKWEQFCNTCDSTYDFKSYDYRRDKSVIHLGLDCSGYVGWVLYNTLYETDGERGYVFKSTEAVKSLAKMGYGERVERAEVRTHRAGDIMSSACGCCSHVYICVGECEDKSLVLLHSSPPGVQLSATYSPDGAKDSQAVELVRSYMKKYYGEWFNRFPNFVRDEKYLTHYEMLTNNFLPDLDRLRNMTADSILKIIIDEYK